MQVIKRDGTVVDYDRAKIAVAIGKANAETEEKERASEREIEAILSFIEGKKIILTNGFVKKSQKTPAGEIARAKKYRADYQSRKEGL